MRNNFFVSAAKVTEFTFLRTVKSKAYILTAVLLCIAIAAAMSLASKPRGEALARFTHKLYITDDSGLPVKWREMFESAWIDGVVTPKVPENAGEFDVSARIAKDENGVNIKITRGERVSRAEIAALSYLLRGAVQEAVRESAKLTDEQSEILQTPVNTETAVAGREDEPQDYVLLDALLPPVLATVLFVFIITQTALIGQSAASEKVSHMMEQLCLYVSPTAVIGGKICGIGLAGLLQMIIFAAVSVFSAGGATAGVNVGTALASQNLEIIGGAAETDGAGVINSVGAYLSEISAPQIIALLTSMLFGFLFYAGLAGLAGVTAERTEDVQRIMQPIVLLGTAGFFLAYAVPMLEAATGKNLENLSAFARWFPFSAPFALPGEIITGSLTLITAAAVLLQVCVSIAVLVFAGQKLER